MTGSVSAWINLIKSNSVFYINHNFTLSHTKRMVRVHLYFIVIAVMCTCVEDNPTFKIIYKYIKIFRQIR